MFKHMYVPAVTASNVTASNLAAGSATASNLTCASLSARSLVAAGGVSNLPVNCVYSSNAEVRNAAVWTATGAVASGGTAAFYPTSDGTAKGAALFKSVLYASATATAGSNAPGGCMCCCLRSVSSDNRTVTFNVASAGGLLADVAVPVGAVVRAMVIGL